MKLELVGSTRSYSTKEISEWASNFFIGVSQYNPRLNHRNNFCWDV